MAGWIRELPDFLEWADGGIRVAGHRVSLALILEAFFAGKGASEMSDLYPTIPINMFLDLIIYCNNNTDVLRDYLLERQARASAFRADHANRGPSLSELRQRMDKLRRGNGGYHAVGEAESVEDDADRG
jgi:uncharacterized protein (DUF433 family)